MTYIWSILIIVYNVIWMRKNFWWGGGGGGRLDILMYSSLKFELLIIRNNLKSRAINQIRL